MRIVHVIEGLPRTAGTTVFPVEIAREQIALGYTVEIVHFTFNECEHSAALIRRLASMDDLGYRPDAVYIHAFWSFCQIRAMSWCWNHKVSFIVSPHGGLMPRVLKKGWLKKHIFFWLFVKPLLQKADAIHCTGEGEVSAVKALGVKTRTFIAPLGCRLPIGVDARRRVGRGRNVLFLGRLSEEKGLELLLDAWKAIEHEGWKLILAGPSWLGYGEILNRKVSSEAITDVEFPGNADDVMKDTLYRHADVFVLPSPTENFSLVVLDALAYGVPVICTQGTPWACLEGKQAARRSKDDGRAGWWIESNSVAAIRTALAESMRLSDEERQSMGRCGREIAQGYSWSEVARKMEVR